MTEPICPLCSHPANKHTEFYCLVPECRCNTSGATAEALYYQNIATEALKTAKGFIELGFYKDAENIIKSALETLESVNY